MRRDRLLRDRIHERFVVTLTDGAAFTGLLSELDERVVRLVDAATLGPNRQQIPVDGELFIERARIAYLQRPGG